MVNEKNNQWTQRNFSACNSVISKIILLNPGNVCIHSLDKIALNTSKIDDGFKYACVKEISLTKILECIKCHKDNKSPGIDGLMGEFYKTVIFI